MKLFIKRTGESNDRFTKDKEYLVLGFSGDGRRAMVIDDTESLGLTDGLETLSGRWGSPRVEDADKPHILAAKKDTAAYQPKPKVETKESF